VSFLLSVSFFRYSVCTFQIFLSNSLNLDLLSKETSKEDIRTFVDPYKEFGNLTMSLFNKKEYSRYILSRLVINCTKRLWLKKYLLKWHETILEDFCILLLPRKIYSKRIYSYLKRHISFIQSKEE